MIDVPYCEKDETSKPFFKKFHELANDLCEIKIKWINKMMRKLCRLKSKIPHATCVLYEGMCIGETKRNVEIQLKEQSDVKEKYEPSRHLKRNETLGVIWDVLMTAPINDGVRKNLEATFIALSRLSLNEQIVSEKLLLFRNCVTI